MSLRVWLPMTKDLSNQGLENISITNNGATLDTNGKLGNCYSFGTAASGLLLANTKMETFTSECSVSFWVNIVSWNVNYATIFQAGKGGRSWSDYVFGVLRNSSGSTLCFTITQGSTSSSTSFQTPSLNLNTWYHLTFIYKTGHCLIYVNGSLYSNSTTTMIPSFSSITKVSVGRANDNQYQSNCKLNDVRIYDHALSAKEVKELSKGLVVHYPLDNNGQGDDNTYTDTTVYDTSGYGNDGKNQYITYETDTPRYSVSSVLSGSSTRITNTTINIGNEWSYGLWFKSAAAARSWEGLVILNNNGGDSDIQLGFYTYPNNSRIQTTANGQYNTISHTYDDKWHHLFATFDGTTLKTYRDGELVDTKTITNSLLSRSNLTFGARRRGEVTFDCPYKGSLSDFRLYATVLSEDDIKELYSSSASIDNNGNIYGYEFKEVE